MHVCLVGGTSECRLLATRLMDLGHRVLLSVATEGGRELLAGLDCEQQIGRLDRDGWLQLLRQGQFDLLLDASHPYAVVVSALLRDVAAELNLPYLRYERPESLCLLPGENLTLVASPEAAAEKLAEDLAAGRIQPPIFLTTGSKDLGLYARVLGPEHLVARILPATESLQLAQAAGLKMDQIIAMQGPFSYDLNCAMFRQTKAGALLSKASGRAGGQDEKVEAALDLNLPLYIIARPADSALEAPTYPLLHDPAELATVLAELFPPEAGKRS